MQFYDEVTIEISSGRGWNGISSGRREAKMAFGWPDGWDGGNGWDLIFCASKNENTLLPYKYKKIFKAHNWEDGRTKDQYGANWEHLTLIVPVGTLIKDKNGNILWHLIKDGEVWTALKWWEGWKWNIHFKNSVNQFPTFAILWEPWHYKEVVLELQLLADVALIWSPSVWKSSLINSISHTKAKVADYPFTTIVPNLWSIKVGSHHFNMIDIPWLISWAAEGKWLGNAFLRHILKARIFCFVADLGRFDQWLNEVPDLFDEIIKYIYTKIDEDVEIKIYKENKDIIMEVKQDSEPILNKKIIFAMNKYDLVNDDEIIWEYKTQFLKNLNKFLKEKLSFEIDKDCFNHNCFVVSAATHFGLEDWTKNMVTILQNTDLEEHAFHSDEELEFKEWEIEMIQDITDHEKNKLLEQWYIDKINSQFAKIWEIDNPEVCKMVFTLMRWNHEAEIRFWKSMSEKWFVSEFEKNWIRKGDVLKIKSYYETENDKYIMY